MCLDYPIEKPRARLRASGKQCSRHLVLLALMLAWLRTDPVAADEYTDAGQPPLPTVTLAIGDTALRTELAISPEQRYRGLGNRRTLAEDEAMLFVYPVERLLTFTMRDTRLPLSIAYLSDALEGADAPTREGDGSGSLIINEIVDMDVGPNQLFPSTRPARYALEVNQGWFGRHDVKAGDVVRVAVDTLR